MFNPKLIKIATVAGACAAVGAGAGILGSAGAAGSAVHSSQKAVKHQKAVRHRLGGSLKRAVHVDAIVPGPNGQFVTVTLDRGVVQSVSGDQLTLVEGTSTAAYKTVTLTIPADAKLRDSGQPAALSALKPGQRVVVIRGPNYTRVRAHDARTR